MQHKEQEFEQLFHEHYGRMYRTAFLLLGDQEEAKDAVSDVFARLWNGTIQIRTSTAAAFLVVSVRNHCLNLLSARHTIPLSGNESEDFDVPEELTDNIYTEQTMRQALQLLTPQKRAIIRLRYNEGLSYKDTAARLGISTAAVNKHIVQALRILREHFKNAQS